MKLNKHRLKKQKEKKDAAAASRQAGEGYSSSWFVERRIRRRKIDWAGVGLGDAFKSDLDYFERMPAQRKFYAECKQTQKNAALLAGQTVEAGFKPNVKPQLSPCYTSYPAVLAANAAVGLTGFLEFESRISKRALVLRMEAIRAGRAKAEGIGQPQAIVERMVAETVQTRLLLEELSHAQQMERVELYRLFAASQQNLKFATLREIVEAVVLYGDVLPHLPPAVAPSHPLERDEAEMQAAIEVHPMTHAILSELRLASEKYLMMLRVMPTGSLAALGCEWVRALCSVLAKYLPDPPAEASSPATGAPEAPKTADANAATQFKFAGPPEQAPDKPASIAPLNGPNPPSLLGEQTPPLSPEEQTMLKILRLKQSDILKAQLAKAPTALAAFSAAIKQASGQVCSWHDIRSDLVEQMLQSGAFSQGPVQGSPTDGHEVSLRLNGDRIAGGEIFDEPVELSDDLPAYEALLDEAQPIADVLRRALYPNVEQVVETERFRTTGSIDPARLAMAYCSTVVFKRNRVREKADRRGRPVVLIACDGSGSLNAQQMQLVRVLAAAWLRSTARSGVEVLAGLYHSGQVRGAVAAPMVRWIHHPQKTPAIGRADAVRAIVSLPQTGTGIQSDALSLAFMLDEARRVARGRMVYLILISDCQWNRSFNTEMSGKDEVLAFFENNCNESGKLHTTLVAVGFDGETGFEGLLDKVVPVPKNSLADYTAVARKIGAYVASCIRERRKITARR